MKKNKYHIQDWGLKVKKSSAGLGLFATKEIPKGVCLIEYFGREISEEEQYTSKSKYLFEINSKITIDGTARENIARYINHSCKPNSEVEIKKRKVFIFSKRKIIAGEEICYDYGKEYFNEYIKKVGCKCVRCRVITHNT
jgi:SET domain-containing protein